MSETRTERNERLDRLIDENVEQNGGMEEFDSLMQQRFSPSLADSWMAERDGIPAAAPSDAAARDAEDRSDRAQVALAEGERALKHTLATGLQAELRIATREVEKLRADASKAMDQAAAERKAYLDEKSWETITEYDTKKKREKDLRDAQRDVDAVLEKIQAKALRRDGSFDILAAHRRDLDAYYPLQEKLDRAKAALDLPITQQDRVDVRAALEAKAAPELERQRREMERTSR